MRLVHHSKDDFGFIPIHGGDLRPQTGKLVVGRATLPDDLPLEAGVVVNVHDAVGTRCEASSYQLVVLRGVGLAQPPVGRG